MTLAEQQLNKRMTQTVGKMIQNNKKGSCDVTQCLGNKETQYFQAIFLLERENYRQEDF